MRFGQLTGYDKNIISSNSILAYEVVRVKKKGGQNLHPKSILGLINYNFATGRYKSNDRYREMKAKSALNCVRHVKYIHFFMKMRALVK